MHESASSAVDARQRESEEETPEGQDEVVNTPEPEHPDVKIIDDQYQFLTRKIGQIERICSYVKKEISGGITIENAAKFFEKAKSHLWWLNIVTSFLLLPFNIYRIIYAAAISKENKYNRGVQVLMGIGGIVLAILGTLAAFGAITIYGPALIIAGAGKAVLEGFYWLGTSIYNRWWGEGAQNDAAIKELEVKITDPEKQTEEVKELTTRINRRRQLSWEIVNKIHNLSQSISVLIGSVLLFTPAAPVGGIILITSAAYGLLDTFCLNPITWAVRGINWLSKKKYGKPCIDTYEDKTPEDITNELKEKIGKKPMAIEMKDLASDNVKHTDTGIFKAIASDTASAKALALEAASPKPAPTESTTTTVAPVAPSTPKTPTASTPAAPKTRRFVDGFNKNKNLFQPDYFNNMSNAF